MFCAICPTHGPIENIAGWRKVCRYCGCPLLAQTDRLSIASIWPSNAQQAENWIRRWEIRICQELLQNGPALASGDVMNSLPA